MRNRYITIILLLALALSLGLPAIASTITSAINFGVITITNNSTATANVATTFTGNTTSWIANSVMNSSGNNTAIRTSSGADVAYMIGDGPDGNPWCVWVPTIGANTNLTDILYTGGSDNMNGKIRYFPGPTGMKTQDAANMEPGDNLTVETIGQLDTTKIGSILWKKELTCRAYIGATGNITFDNGSFDTADFLDYAEVDANGKLTVTSSTATAVDADTDEDVYLYFDFGVAFFNSLDIDFEIYGDSATLLNGQGGIAITNTEGSFNDFAATDMSVQFVDVGASNSIYLYRGKLVASDSYLNAAFDTPFYCTLTRAAGNDAAQLKIYSDAARATLLDTLNLGGYGAATRYRYAYGFVSYNRSDAGGQDFDGYVKDMVITRASTFEASVAGIPTGDYPVVITANTTHVNVTADGQTGLDTVMVALPDTGGDWIVSENATFDYILHHKQTVGGNLVQHIEWEYTDNFTDLSGNLNAAIPSFRGASSDPDVSASLSSFQPISEAQAPAYTLAEAPAFFTVIPGVTGNFTVNVTPTYPGRDVIVAVAAKGLVPENLVTMIMAAFMLIVFSLGISYMMKNSGVNSLFIKMCIITAGMCVLVAVQVFDVWQVYFFTMIALSLCWLSRQREAY